MLSIYDLVVIYFHCYMLYIFPFILDITTCLFNSYFKLPYIFIGSMVLVVFTMYHGCSTVGYHQDAFAIDIS